MGRKRKPENAWMPERVYPGKSAYEFQPLAGGCIRLCPLTATKSTVYLRYKEEVRKLEHLTGSIAQLFRDYLNSPQFAKLALSTRKKQTSYATHLDKIFGKMNCACLKPLHVRKWMDLRGKKSEVSANREFSFLSKAFSWGYERGMVPINPSKGVKKFTEKPRGRYITDEEYAAVYDAADPIIQATMEICYCCAARISDVLALKVDSLSDNGIRIKQGKTGKAQIKAWSPRLRTAIKAVQVTQRPSLSRLITNEKGQPLTYAAFSYRWKKAKRLAAERYPGMKFDFTFHDTKARAISDWKGDRQEFSGHKTVQQAENYDRKVHIVDTH